MAQRSLRSKRGLLEKCKSENVIKKAWNSYHFQVSGSTYFQYFKKEMTEPHAQVLLAHVTKITVDPFKGVSFPFQVHFKGKGSPWILNASSNEERMSWMEAIKPGSSATLQHFSKGRGMTLTPPPPEQNSMQPTYYGQQNMTPNPQLHHSPQRYTGQQNMTPSPQLHHGSQRYTSQQQMTPGPQMNVQQPSNDLQRAKSFSDAAQRGINVPIDLNQTWPSTTRPPLPQQQQQPLPQQPEEYMEPVNFTTTALSNRANPSSRATISHPPRNQGPPVPPPRPVLRSITSPKFPHEPEPEEYVVMQPTSPVSPISPLTQSPFTVSPPPHFSPPSHTPPPPHTPPPAHTPPPPQNPPPPSLLRPVPRPRKDRCKEREPISTNNSTDGDNSEEPEVDAHNYVTLVGNQHSTSSLTQSVTTGTPTSSLTNAGTSSSTSSLTNSLTNSMKRMQMQANGNFSPSEEGPLSALVDQLAANLSPDQQAMLIQMLQQTEPRKQTDEEIKAAWEIPQEAQARTEGTPSSPPITYEGTDLSTLRGGLHRALSHCPELEYRHLLADEDDERSYIPRPDWAKAMSTDVRRSSDGCNLDTLSEMQREALFIPRSNLDSFQQIGEGQFGKVYKALLQQGVESVPAAVKTTKKTSSESEMSSFMREMTIMSGMMHPNIVRLYGLVQDDVSTPWIVLEYLPHGDLKSFLMKNERPVKQLVKYMIDIAMGMHYISEKGLVHRDLAARNILVGEGELCKVADFGLLRELPKDDSIYHMQTNVPCPVRWMPPESILDRSFSTASDVWSFGILQWEMFNPHKTPYQNLGNIEVATRIMKGYRLPVPRDCPQVVVRIMKSCWNQSPEKRPSFLLISTLLSTKATFSK